MPKLDETITVAQAHELTGFSGSYITSQCYAGEIEATQRVPRSAWRIKRRSLLAWVLSRKSIGLVNDTDALPVDTGNLLSVSEVAELADRSEHTVRRHCRDGLLAAEKVANSCWLIQRADLANYIRNLPRTGPKRRTPASGDSDGAG